MLPAHPASPNKVPTEWLGARSVITVCTLAAQPANPKSDRASKTITQPGRETVFTKIHKGTMAVKPTMQTLREKLMLKPRRIKKLDVHPPTRFPKSAVRKGTQSKPPTIAMLKFRSRKRYSGIQNK